MSDMTADELISLLPGATTERRTWLRQILAEAHRRTLARRERVLRYPDLAARLTEPPLNYARPEQWNGFVPPRWGQLADPEVLRSPVGEANKHGKRAKGRQDSDTPYRQALITIAAEAWTRDVESGKVDAGSEPDILGMFPWHGPRAEQPPMPYDSGVLGAEQNDDQAGVESADYQHEPARGRE